LGALWVLLGRKWAGWQKSKGLAEASKNFEGRPKDQANENRKILETYSNRRTWVEGIAIILVAAGVLFQFIDVWQEKRAMAANPSPTAAEVATLIGNSEKALREEWKRDIATATSATNGRLDALGAEVKELQRRVKALEDRFQGGKGSGKGGGGPDPDKDPRPDSGGGGAEAANAARLEELAEQVAGLEIRVTSVEHNMQVPFRVGVPIETV